jgi:catechol 2,3-dioxygenase-like lactoylglutathione lyase family enzyme
MPGRLHHVVIDCPQPELLAGFYSKLLGLPVTYRSDDWVVVSENDTTSGVALQLAPDHVPPEWGNPAHPQQMHFDVMVDDLDAVSSEVESMGARPLSDEQDGSRVFADPAGHPFCLVPRPTWAPPISPPANLRTPR